MGYVDFGVCLSFGADVYDDRLCCCKCQVMALVLLGVIRIQSSVVRALFLIGYRMPQKNPFIVV